MDTRTNEQRELGAIAERNTAATRALILCAKGLGLNGEQTLAAFVTAMTTIIEVNVPAAERLLAMNALLAPTITEWAGSPAAGSRIQ